MLDGFEYGGLGYLVEYDAVGVLLVKPQHLAEVPRDGFPLAVFIGGEPYLVGLFGVLAQLLYELGLLRRNFVVGLERVGVDAQLLFLEVAYVSVA